MSGRALYGDLESKPLGGPTQAWFFNLHSILTDSALHCCSCFMQTNHILASTDRTIQYIVSFAFYAKFVLNTSEIAQFRFLTVIRILQSLFSIFMKKCVRSLRTGFPLAGCPIMVTILPSVQDRITKVTRLGKFGCFMTAFANF
jgi:hypothetical protein